MICVFKYLVINLHNLSFKATVIFSASIYRIMSFFSILTRIYSYPGHSLL